MSSDEDCTVQYDANGYWRSDAGRRAMAKEPVTDLSWLTMETIGPDWAPPWWLAVPLARLRRLMRL